MAPEFTGTGENGAGARDSTRVGVERAGRESLEHLSWVSGCDSQKAIFSKLGKKVKSCYEAIYSYPHDTVSKPSDLFFLSAWGTFIFPACRTDVFLLRESCPYSLMLDFPVKLESDPYSCGLAFFLPRQKKRFLPFKPLSS